jgi:hypothetical protein
MARDIIEPPGPPGPEEPPPSLGRRLGWFAGLAVASAAAVALAAYALKALLGGA